MRPRFHALHASLPLLALLLAAPAAVAEVQLYEYTGAPGEQLGASVAVLGDIDGDGIGDFAVGIPGTGSDIGRVEVRSGADGSLLTNVPGLAPGDRFGYAIDALADIDGDGRTDLVIGAPNHGASGSVHVASSVTGLVHYGTSAGSGVSFLGYSVATLSDVDGDGVRDFAVGAPTSNSSTGMVLVCSGASAAGLYIKTGGTAGEQFGYDVAAVGDVDHDGIVDFVAGARYAKVSIHPHAGYATLHSGATGNLLNTVVGSIDNGELGTSVAGVGDINGDGTPDWAVGQPGSDLNGPDSGRVIVITGNGPPYSVLRVLLGANGTRFGTAVAGIGDYDGDGTPDVMVGAPLYDKLGGGDAGQVTVWSGSTSSQLYWRLGEHGSEQLGRTVGTAGDLNGDGKQELVMGSGFSAVGGSYSGVLRVFLANATGPAVYCKTKTNSAGCHPAIYGEGVASFSVGNGFRVGAISVLPGNPGMMFWSRSDAAIPFRGGTLCLGSPLFRTTGQVAGGSPGSPCSGTYLFEFDGAYAASHALAPGDTVYAQYWSRDGGFAPPDNVGLTNALRFTFAP